VLFDHPVGKRPQFVGHVDFGTVNERIVNGNEKPLFGFANPLVEHTFEHTWILAGRPGALEHAQTRHPLGLQTSKSDFWLAARNGTLEANFALENWSSRRSNLGGLV
jgi:hypothetical protein